MANEKPLAPLTASDIEQMREMTWGVTVTATLVVATWDSQQAEIERLRAALADLATPRPYVDMADSDDEQERDALSALCRLHEVARKALGGTARALPIEWQHLDSSQQYTYVGELLRLNAADNGDWWVEADAPPKIGSGPEDIEAAKAAAIAAARGLLRDALAELGGGEG